MDFEEMNLFTFYALKCIRYLCLNRCVLRVFLAR